MYLSELELKNFRNYQSETLKFSPQINVLIGQNAQGKTNLLESIYFLAMARSHRTTTDKEMINFQENIALIKGIVQKQIGQVKLEINLSNKGKKAKRSGAYKTEEGCLSLDGVRPCTRYKEIEVDYLDQDFKKQHGSYSGWSAQIIQHEIDHCRGIVI